MFNFKENLLEINTNIRIVGGCGACILIDTHIGNVDIPQYMQLLEESSGGDIAELEPVKKREDPVDSVKIVTEVDLTTCRR